MLIVEPFFMEKKEWYRSGKNGLELTELGASIPDVKKDFELFKALDGVLIQLVDDDGNVIDNPSERKLQAFEDFEEYLQEKYKNRLP